jgi:hypothetical protein
LPGPVFCRAIRARFFVACCSQETLLEDTMELIELEVFTQDRNMSVVRLPGRRTPGSVIPADALRHLCFLAESIVDRVREDHDRELCDDSEELCELLLSRLRVFEEATRDMTYSPTGAYPKFR